MKILSIRSARSIWLVPLVYIKPKGRFLIPAVPAIVERYGFLKRPDVSALVASPTTLKFEVGAFVGSDGIAKQVSLSVHDDGLIAEMRSSTDDCDLFLEDALKWLAEEFQLPRIGEPFVRKVYASELSVQFDGPVEIFNDRFSSFVNSLKSGLGTHQPRPMALTHINFGSEPAPGAQSTALRIEREVGTPFAENRYYSAAAIPTNDHLDLLRKFEEAATGQSGNG
ncbi:MAG: hypothetical protein JWO04_730 [Gammaproteobacteria bacterium]|nr:hypothetical protein [Gammaproteobacteria bacterium]